MADTESSDFSDHKLIDEGENHYILQDPNGESFTVAKDGLDDDMHDKIKMYAQNDVQPLEPTKSDYAIQGDEQQSQAMHNLDEKNQATEQLLAEQKQAEIEASKNAMAKRAMAPASSPRSVAVEPQPEVNQPVESISAPVTPAQPTAPIAPDLTKSILDSQNRMSRGYDMAAKAEAEKAQATAKAYEAEITRMNEVRALYEKERAPLLAQRDKLMQEVSSGKIDPNNYWNSMGTGNKILAAISIGLGGYSQGLTGAKTNPAMDVINRSIDADIEAQKANLSQKNNLLSRNFEMTRDMDAAEAKTRSDLSTITAAQVAKAAAQSGGQTALANAEILKAQLGLQSTEALNKVAINRVSLQGADPLTTKIALYLPEKEREAATKEYGEHTAHQKALANVDDIYKKYGQVQTVGNHVMNPIQSSKQASAINASLVQTVMEASPSKRLTRESVEQEIEPFEIKVSDSAETRLAKLNQIKNIINTNQSPTPILSGRGWLPKNTGVPTFTKSK